MAEYNESIHIVSTSEMVSSPSMENVSSVYLLGGSDVSSVSMLDMNESINIVSTSEVVSFPSMEKLSSHTYLLGRSDVSSVPVLDMSESIQIVSTSEVVSFPSVEIEGGAQRLEGTSSLVTSFNKFVYGSSRIVSSSSFSVVTGLVENSISVNINTSFTKDALIGLSSIIKPVINFSPVVELDRFTAVYTVRFTVEIESDVTTRVLSANMLDSIEMDFSSIVEGFELHTIPLIAYPEFYDSLLSMLPEIYRENEDCRVFINLMARELGGIKEGISMIPKLKDPTLAPREFLPYISSMIGYKYRYDIPEEESRIILENLLEVRRRRGSPRILKAAIKFRGHPEDLLTKLEDYDDVHFNTIDIGLIEVLYEDYSLRPEQGYLRDYKQAGVRVVFGLLRLSEFVERYRKIELSILMEVSLKVFRQNESLMYETEKELGLSVVRKSKIWGSPVFSTGDVSTLSIDSYLINQPDFEIVTEPIS